MVLDTLKNQLEWHHRRNFDEKYSWNKEMMKTLSMRNPEKIWSNLITGLNRVINTLAQTKRIKTYRDYQPNFNEGTSPSQRWKKSAVNLGHWNKWKWGVKKDHFRDKIVNIQNQFKEPKIDPIDLLKKLIPRRKNNFILKEKTIEESMETTK